MQNQAANTVHNNLGGLIDLAGAVRNPAQQAELISHALDQFTRNTESNSRAANLGTMDFEIFSRRNQGSGQSAHLTERWL